MSSWQWLCDAVFPARCIVCKREGDWFCVRHNKFPPAPKNEAEFEELDEIYAATAYYDDNVRKAVEFFKFRGFSSLADKFGEVISERVPAELLKDATFVPIPLHWTRKWWRGFNQAEKIAQALKKRNPGANISLELKRVRRTQQQAKLKRKERLENLSEAFIWTGGTLTGKVILIDDVIASGKTLDAATAEMKKHGINKVSGVVFARGGKP